MVRTNIGKENIQSGDCCRIKSYTLLSTAMNYARHFCTRCNSKPKEEKESSKNKIKVDKSSLKKPFLPCGQAGPATVVNLSINIEIRYLFHKCEFYDIDTYIKIYVLPKVHKCIRAHNTRNTYIHTHARAHTHKHTHTYNLIERGSFPLHSHQQFLVHCQ